MTSISFQNFSQALSDAAGLVPQIGPLIGAIGFFGLEPRVRELASLAVAQSAQAQGCISVHRTIGKAAGLTEAERKGSTEGLTSAELSAINLALETVDRFSETTPEIDSADQHFPPEQIRQLQAIARLVDFNCKLENSMLKRLSPRTARA